MLMKVRFLPFILVITFPISPCISFSWINDIPENKIKNLYQMWEIELRILYSQEYENFLIPNGSIHLFFVSAKQICFLK